MVTVDVDELNRLDGWKEIAAFIGRSVMTARRRARAGMPVYKLPMGGVFADKVEIKAWEREVGLKVL